MIRLIKYLLAPTIIKQGRRVRKTALILPEPPGKRSGTRGEGPPLSLLLLGDSGAASVGAPTQEKGLLGNIVRLLSADHRVSFNLRAKTGAKTTDTIERVQQMSDGTFDIVVTCLGVNDITSNVPLWRWIRQQRTLLDEIDTKLQPKQIIVSGFPPVDEFPLLPEPLRWVLGKEAKQFDARLQKLVASRDNCSYVRVYFDHLDVSHMSEDGFHPGPEIYEAWAEAVVSHITPRT